MTPRFSVLVPSRDRVRGLSRVIENVLLTTAGHDVEIIPVVDEPDTESIRLVESAGPLVRPVIVDASYLGRPQAKYNAGYTASRGEWIVTGADDITFDSNSWLDAALNVNRKGWVGLYDGVHELWAFATLIMATRQYLDTVMKGKVGLEWYHVWFADMEHSARAQQVGAYVVCPDARFTHHHRAYDSAQDDHIYELASTWYVEDDVTFQRRSRKHFPDPEPGFEVIGAQTV